MPVIITHADDARYVTFDKENILHAELEKVYNAYTKALSEAWKLKKKEIASVLSSEEILRIEQYITNCFLAVQSLRRIGEQLLGYMIDLPIEAYESHIFTYDSVPELITLPDSLVKIAQLYSPDRGTRTGKGEFIIPLLFKDGVWNSADAVYDVTINKVNWHVKAVPRLGVPIQMGKAGYANSTIGKKLGKFMSASELSAGTSITGFVGNFDAIHALPDFANLSTIDFINAFQTTLDKELREISINDAAGVIFYAESNLLHFINADECYCQGATQSNHLVGVSPNFLKTYYDKHQKKLKKAVYNNVASRFRKNMALRYAKSRQRKKWQEPSFTHVAKQFAARHDLNVEEFIAFCLNDSTCVKTFERWFKRNP